MTAVRCGGGGFRRGVLRIPFIPNASEELHPEFGHSRLRNRHSPRASRSSTVLKAERVPSRASATPVAK
jgi:hypothetical protein